MKYVVMVWLCGLMLFVFSGCGGDAAFGYADSTSAADDPVPAFSCTEETSTSIYVDVCGEVMKPGVYCLSRDARVCDAVFAAGGFTEEADRSRVNQARILSDQEQILVPSIEEEQETDDNLVCINTADAEALTALPGIGEAKAADIIAYREAHGAFSSPEDIMKVPGIKEALYNKIKTKIKI